MIEPIRAKLRTIVKSEEAALAVSAYLQRVHGELLTIEEPEEGDKGRGDWLVYGKLLVPALAVQELPAPAWEKFFDEGQLVRIQECQAALDGEGPCNGDIELIGMLARLLEAAQEGQDVG